MNHNAYQCQLGRTPLVPVQLALDTPTVWCKLEFLNPSGSIKDRIAHYILGKAMRCGSLQAGGSVVEASSGSTSIAMALACAQLGLKFTAIMPANVSRERILMIEAYGAAIELTPPDEGIEAAIHSAKRHADAGSFGRNSSPIKITLKRTGAGQLGKLSIKFPAAKWMRWLPVLALAEASLAFMRGSATMAVRVRQCSPNQLPPKRLATSNAVVFPIVCRE